MLEFVSLLVILLFGIPIALLQSVVLSNSFLQDWDVFSMRLSYACYPVHVASKYFYPNLKIVSLLK